MAKIRKNAVVQGASGKFGDSIVFRQLADGQTIITQAPRPDPNREKKPGEIANQNRFQQAIIYGKAAKSNPELNQLYENEAAKKPLHSAFNVAVADYMKAPSIQAVDVSKYSGKIGDTITITATDDFQVKEVLVTIFNPDGSISDHGMAINDPSDTNKWLWIASNTNPSLTGDKIVVTASDLPGSLATLEKELE
jgi:hypothetical protein